MGMTRGVKGVAIEAAAGAKVGVELAGTAAVGAELIPAEAALVGVEEGAGAFNSVVARAIGGERGLSLPILSDPGAADMWGLTGAIAVLAREGAGARKAEKQPPLEGICKSATKPLGSAFHFVIKGELKKEGPKD